MRRLFGSNKPAAPLPSLEDSSKRLDSTISSLDEKIKKLEVELTGYKQQLNKSRAGSPAQSAIKQKALRVLKQKKMYEAQRDQIMGQQWNLQQAHMTTQSIQDTIQTVNVMKVGAQVMKKELKNLKMNDIDKLQDDMQDMLDTTNEIQDALSRSYAVPNDVDEEDLDAELAALGDEISMEDSLPSYLQTPSAPTEVPGSAQAELKFPSIPQSQTV